MSLVNRIEMANLNNMAGDRGGWDPMIRYVLIDTMGKTTMINATNGGGKTTLCIGVIGMLARNHKLMNDFHQRMCPVHIPDRASVFSHLRVEFLVPDANYAVGSGNLLSGVEERVPGHQYVFGVYGNSGDQGRMVCYTYPGTLEDAPILESANTLRSNKAFIEGLRGARAKTDPTREEWITEVSEHIERSSILDMARIQCMPSEDKIIEYFQVRKRKEYGSYDVGFFFDILAPILLSGLMDGEVDASEEHSFQDTVLTSLKHVFRARFQVARKAKELRHLTEAIGHLQGATDSGQRALALNAQLQSNLAAATNSMAGIQSMAVANPIPGVPRAIAGDDVRAMLASHIVMSDLDSEWRIRDAGIAWLIGESVSAVNQLAARNYSEGRQLTQVIEYSCDSSIRSGPKARYYTELEALKLVEATQSVAHGLTKSSAADELRDAFWHVGNKLDSNPFRAARIAKEDVVAQDERQLVEVQVELESTSRRVGDLESEQKTITADQDQFNRLAESGAFTQKELESPEHTLDAVEKDARTTQTAHESLVSGKSKAEMFMPSWTEFAKEFGDAADPADILTQLQGEKEAVRSERQSKKMERAENAVQLKRASDVARKESKSLGDAANKVAELKPMLDALSQFEQQHPGKIPGKFEAEVRAGISGEEKRERDATGRIATLKQAQADIAAFAAFNTGISPQERLTLAKIEHLRVSGEIIAAQGEESSLARQLDALNKESIAPTQEYHRALTRLSSTFKFEHVHDVLSKLPGAKKKAAFEQFSALLFAPCFSNAAQALEAAVVLDEAKIRIPVVHAEGLATYLQSSEDAIGVFVGSMTREAACLLDPALIPKEKKRLAQELEDTRRRVAVLQEELAAWALDAPVQVAAAKSIQASSLEPAKNLPIAQEALREATDFLEKLKRLIEPAALQIIRRAADCVAQNARAQEQKARLEVDRAQTALASAEADAARLEELLARQDDEIQRLSERFESILPALRENNLRNSASLLKLGLPTDRDALDAMLAKSSDKLAKAQQRAQFGIALRAAQRHVDRVRRGGMSVDKELSEAKVKVSGLTNEVGRVRDSISHAKADAVSMRQPERQLDAVVIKLQKQYRACHAVLSSLVTLDARAVTEAVPSYVLDMRQLLRGEMTREVGLRVERFIEQLRADLEEFNAEDIGKALDAQRRERERELTIFSTESRKASESNALRDVERMVLKEAIGIDGVTAVLGLHETLVEKLKIEQEVHQQISRWEGDQFSAAADRLKSFIASAASGLDLLKRICKSDDSSNMRFHIEATICDEAAVSSMLKALFADFEQDWEVREAAAQRRGETDDSVKKQDDLLKEMIQKACFTKIFANPRIRYESSLLRKEGKHTFDLTQFSGGQKTALILAWMVRLNDFQIRRDMQKKGSSTLRKQARRYQSNFMIIDGLFSNLSHMPLIHESLRDIAAGRNDGRFQLIGLMHNPAYVNDPLIFPTLVLGRHNVTDPSQPGWLMVEQSKSAGSLEMTHLFVAPKTVPSRPGKAKAAQPPAR